MPGQGFLTVRLQAAWTMIQGTNAAHTPTELHSDTSQRQQFARDKPLAVGQDHHLLGCAGACCFTALQRKPRSEDLALAEEILLSSG